MSLPFFFISDLHLCLFGVEDMQRVMIATSSFVLFRQINRARTCIPHPNRHSLLHWIQKPKTKVWAKLDMQNSKTSLDVTHRPLSSALSAVPPHVTAAFIPNHSYHALGKTTRKRQHRIFPSAIIFIYCGTNPLPFTFCQETYVFPQHMYSHYFWITCRLSAECIQFIVSATSAFVAFPSNQSRVYVRISHHTNHHSFQHWMPKAKLRRCASGGNLARRLLCAGPRYNVQCLCVGPHCNVPCLVCDAHPRSKVRACVIGHATNTLECLDVCLWEQTYAENT